MLRVWIGGWRHVEHLDPTKAHTGELYHLEVLLGHKTCRNELRHIQSMQTRMSMSRQEGRLQSLFVASNVMTKSTI